ncbi:MAG TPA: response regulator [Bryobacteraceae bacterium]|nr:response regulator [Bryobacteraceae bacterium]
MSNPAKPKVLIIEDNPSDVQLFQLALEEVGLECDLIIVQDGGEALAWVQAYVDSNDSSDRLDLAVIDLNLPKYDGLEILSTMRILSGLQRVPALVLSSSASPKDIARVRSLPDTEYMTKPLDLDQYIQLGNLVRRLLDGHR